MTKKAKACEAVISAKDKIKQAVWDQLDTDPVERLALQAYADLYKAGGEAPDDRQRRKAEKSLEVELTRFFNQEGARITAALKN